MKRILLKVIGVKKLVRWVWEIILPILKKWAASDGKENWNDEVVRLADELISMILDDLDENHENNHGDYDESDPR